MERALPLFLVALGERVAAFVLKARGRKRRTVKEDHEKV
jgi:hypothetical protein